MISIMMGMLMTTVPKAFSEVAFKALLRLANFSSSWSSRTKDFTTRIPVKFSWTTRFRASVFSCRDRNSGLTRVRMTTTMMISSGSATRNTLLS